tara:strand:+ start:131 stop:457 length:327 start_codon:yes stop_codon:yes gene_type:complete
MSRPLNTENFNVQVMNSPFIDENAVEEKNEFRLDESIIMAIVAALAIIVFFSLVFMMVRKTAAKLTVVKTPPTAATAAKLTVVKTPPTAATAAKLTVVKTPPTVATSS